MKTFSSNLQQWLNRDPLSSIPKVFTRFRAHTVSLSPWEGHYKPNLYSFSENAPTYLIDPDGLWTFQVGVSFSVYLGWWNFNVSTGITGDTQGNINAYTTIGTGPGTGSGVSAGVSVAVSNAKCNNDLGGAFGGAGGGVGLGPSASGDVFWGPSDHGPVFGVGGTVGVGVGGGVWVGPTDTVINHSF